MQGLNIAVASSDGKCQMVAQSDYEFSNKVVLITGSSGSVGSRVLDFFTSHGATTIGTYLDDKNTDTTRASEYYRVPRFRPFSHNNWVSNTSAQTNLALQLLR